MTSDQPTSFGEVLQMLRKQKRMGQQPLADRLGVHRNTIGAWERGDRLPETRGMVLELARVLQLSEEETSRLLQASLTGLSSYWQVPYPRNPFFSGRAHLLIHLHQQLGRIQTVALNQSYGITGLGGIGKTQLVLEYAYQHAHDYHAVFWVSAETIDTIYSDFTLIAEQLKIIAGEKQNQQQLVKAVHRWLATHKDWLLIFDNVEDLSLLKSFLPPARAGAVLVTTRLHALAGLAHTLELSAFPPEEALRFLLSRAHLADREQPLDEVPQDILIAARTLVAETAGLPLALDQAGAYLEQTRCTMADYLRLFERHPVRLLDERPMIADHPHSVVQTFLLSFQKIEQDSEAAGDLLRLCAFLHPDAIPEELLLEGSSHWSSALEHATSDRFLLDQTLGAVLQFSLLNRSANHKMLSLHRLVQAVLLETMSEVEQRSWLGQVIAALETVFPGVEPSIWNQCERLLPHALLCLQRADASQENLALAGVASKAAVYLRERGRYGQAEPLFQRALSIYGQQLGETHLRIASLLTELATLSRRQGKYAEAEQVLLRALSIYEQQLGETHVQVATPLTGLATLYVNQGRYGQAEPLFQRALFILEQHLGETHLQVAEPLGGLATLYSEQGKYAEAEPLFQRALSIYKQQLGETHPQIAYPLNGLATLYFDQGKYAEAEPLYRQAVAIFERQLGETHPHVAALLHNLANLYRKQGEYGQAEPLFQRALFIFEQQLGETHVQVAYPLNGLAELYQAQENYAKAEPLFQRALSLYKQHLGETHPQVAHSLQGLAELYQAQENYATAESFYQQALFIREHHLEAQHPDTADTLHGFATLREAQGNGEEAASLSHRALLIREQVLGPQHPKTTQTREYLRRLLVALGKTEQAFQPSSDLGQTEV
jgi:tetratricopeptide (TPR) repeat protein/transcriptional regulator with XRE-family HTH domain